MRSTLFLAVIALGACSLLEDSSTMIGTVVALNVSWKEAPNVHVKESDTDQCGIVFSASAATIWKKPPPGARPHPVPPAQLMGRRVRVYWSGVVLESCPAQAWARSIEVLD